MKMPATRSSDIKPEMINKDEANISKTDVSCLLVSKDDVFQGEVEAELVTLRHPGTQKLCKFLINKTTREIYELQTFKEPFRSWFINNRVKSDGKFHISTPIDPLFLILPLLKEQCVSRAVPLEHLLASHPDTDLKQLGLLNLNLSSVGELKGPADLSAYKYDEEKTLQWLEKKVKRVYYCIKDKLMHVKVGAVSATFVTSDAKREDNDDKEACMKYAFGIVCEYLDEGLCAALMSKLNIRAEIRTINNNKRKSEAGGDHDNEKKKSKTEENPGCTEEEVKSVFFDNAATQKKVLKPAVLTTKEKQMQKAASGTKSIMSFFSKK